MTRPTQRLVLGLASLCAVYGAVTVMTAYFLPFRSDTSRVLWGLPLGVGALLLAGILAYFVAGLLAAIFFAGRRLASKESPPLSDFLSGKGTGDGDGLPTGQAATPIAQHFLRDLVPALAEYVWVLIWMGVFSLVSTPLAVGLAKFLIHRAG